MAILLTGATGFVGSSVLKHLVERGHSVTALVRSADKVAAVEAAGATVVLGDITDVALVSRLATESDGVIHTASPGDATSHEVDDAFTDAVLAALDGTDKPYLHTGGIWVYGNGQDITEDDAFDAPAITAWRLAVEARVRASAVKTTIVAPGIVYGGGNGIPNIFQSDPVRLFGPGTQRWATVHVDDLGALYALAYEQGARDAYYIGASGQNPTVMELAGAASRGNAVVKETREETHARLGAAFADALLLDQHATGSLAKSVLGWNPSGPSLVAELETGSYRR
jgi:nucleoside-diphosphate-sugar epimerase